MHPNGIKSIFKINKDGNYTGRSSNKGPDNVGLGCLCMVIAFFIISNFIGYGELEVVISIVSAIIIGGWLMKEWRH